MDITSKSSVSKRDSVHNADSELESSSADGCEFPFFKPFDLAIYAILAACLVLLLGHGGGDTSTVRVHGPSQETILDLSRDTLLTVRGALGPVTVLVDSGRARIAESPCPGRQCMDRGWIEEAGETSVCIPSGVWIICESDAPGPDAVTY
jgi:hypothetical protein